MAARPARHHEALLTTRQLEVLMYLDDTIQTTSSIVSEMNSIAVRNDPLWPFVTRETIYATLRILEKRGLALRDDTKWPQQWTASLGGQLALDAAEATPSLATPRSR